MEPQKIGVMEPRKIGVMEYWSGGVMGPEKTQYTSTPTLHYSNSSRHARKELYGNDV
jgi:hypothetical protein